MKWFIWKIRYMLVMLTLVHFSVSLRIAWDCACAAEESGFYNTFDNPRDAVLEELSYWGD